MEGDRIGGKLRTAQQKSGKKKQLDTVVSLIQRRYLVQDSWYLTAQLAMLKAKKMPCSMQKKKKKVHSKTY